MELLDCVLDWLDEMIWLAKFAANASLDNAKGAAITANATTTAVHAKNDFVFMCIIF